MTPRTHTCDTVFVGTGLIAVLEAVYQSRCGKSVLMIDRQHGMGGAWLSLEIFGLHDVENAIHYFLPDPHAFDFMRTVLGWDIIRTPRKYRVFRLPLVGYGRLPYDHVLSRIIGRMAADRTPLVRKLARAIRITLSERRPPSLYIRGGAPEMLRKTGDLLLGSDVDVMYSTSIDRIHIDPEASTVDVFTDAADVRAKTIVFTHGSHIRNLRSPSGPFHLPSQTHRRPAVHLLVRDNSPTPMYECIFTNDQIIKYVHDVTRLTREAADLSGTKKLFVLGLHTDVEQTDRMYDVILDTLRRVGLISRAAVLEDRHWWDAYLPRLGDAELEMLKATFGGTVEYLKTENFARGVGYYTQRWSTKLQSPTPPHASHACATSSGATACKEISESIG